MAVVYRTKGGLYIRKHEGFGVLVYAPQTGLFYAVGDNQADIDDIVSRNKTHLHWLPSRPAFANSTNYYIKQPIVINWLLSSQCNCKCVYCYATDVQDESLTKEQIENNAKKILAQHPLAVVLSGGEPFLHPDLIINAIQCLGGNTGLIIDTNGTISIPELLPLLAKNNVVVRVSLDSSLQKRVDSLRPYKDKEKKDSIKAIVHNIALFRSHKIPVIIQTVATPLNTPSLEDILVNLPKLDVQGWRIFMPITPNNLEQQVEFKTLMIHGAKSLEEATKNIKGTLNQRIASICGKSEIPIQIIDGGDSVRNSVLLMLPNGSFATENIYSSEKIILDESDIENKLNFAAHMERYLTKD